MDEQPLAVASAVIVPEESAEQASLSSPTLKRRQSPTPDDEQSKRPRLDQDEPNGSGDSAALPSAAPLDRASERRKTGQVEERKRGQRLFGALIGTLSQSSSSTAQKRRTDIQQAKLKLQVDEQDEKKKQRREALLAARKKEQVIYDRQSVKLRHSNMLAQAHFLHTTAEPKLYYKPWELLPGDEEKLKAQIEEAEGQVRVETEQWDEEHPIADSEFHSNTEPKVPVPEDQEKENSDTVGSITNGENLPIPKQSEDTNMNGTAVPDNEQQPSQPPESSKDQGDDGGEVVEGEEDTVIY